LIFGKHINKYYLKYGILLLLGVAALLVVDWFQLQIPKNLGQLVNHFEEGLVTQQYMSKFVKEFITIVLIMVVGRFFWRIFVMGTSRQILYDLRAQLFDHALILDQPYYQTHKVGAIMAFFSNDAETIRASFGRGTLMLFDSLFLAILVVSRMLKMDWKLTLFSTIPLIFLGIVGFIIIRKMRMKFRLRQDAFEYMNEFTQESFSGIAIIKGFVKEVKEALLFEEINDDFYNKHMDFVRTMIWVNIVITVFINLTIAAIFGFGSYLAIINPAQFKVGHLFEFFTLFGTLIWPVMALTQFANLRSQAMASYQRISGFLDAKPLIKDDTNILNFYLNALKQKEDAVRHQPYAKFYLGEKTAKSIVISKDYPLGFSKEDHKVQFNIYLNEEIRAIKTVSLELYGLELNIPLKKNLFNPYHYEGYYEGLLPEVIYYKVNVIDFDDEKLQNEEGFLKYQLIKHQKEEELKGSITFNNLSFAYPDAPNTLILKNINVEIKAGESVGVLGRTGSGKSTFVDLLLRTYNVDNDSIYLDHYDIMSLNIQNVRNNIAYVPQDNFLYSTTIAENIAFSEGEMAFDRIVEAAKLSDVYDNIAEFKDGFKTTLGERGVTVSGGQKQRISIARALAKEAPILILDDSVSAVDTNTEEAILANLERVRKGKTTILIAHRISTVRKLDKIILLDQGQLKAVGTHDELMKSSELYQDMVRRQTLEGRVMGDA